MDLMDKLKELTDMAAEIRKQLEEDVFVPTEPQQEFITEATRGGHHRILALWGRATGKTTVLREIAKRFNYNVAMVVPTYQMSRQKSKEFPEVRYYVANMRDYSIEHMLRGYQAILLDEIWSYNITHYIPEGTPVIAMTSQVLRLPPYGYWNRVHAIKDGKGFWMDFEQYNKLIEKINRQYRKEIYNDTFNEGLF